jgi:thiamine kinase-like enzyme
MGRRFHRHNYHYLRHLIQQSLADRPGFGARVEVDGKISRLADGLWHKNYWFWIQGRGLPAARAEHAYVLRLLDQREDWQSGPEPRDRLVREAETLQVLKKTDFAHPTPEFICFVEDETSEPIGMIETALAGFSLHGSKERTTLKLIGQVAANVHRLGVDQFPHLPASDNPVRHVQEQLNDLDESLFAEFSLANEVRDWIETHPPSVYDRCVLHGDLLPQNLLCDWPASGREDLLVGVVDWEMAKIGDPAYDLAIVSRGNRKVLGMKEGIKVLVEEYVNLGGTPISSTDVHVHELLLVLNLLEEAWREHQEPQASGHGPDFYEDKLRSLFRRAAD